MYETLIHLSRHRLTLEVLELVPLGFGGFFWEIKMSAEDFSALAEYVKQKFDADRARFLREAKTADDGGWTKHTDYHWSRTVRGKRLDYWPSRKKWQYDGKVLRGLRGMYKVIEGGAE